MFLCVLIGAFTVALTIGLIDVLVVQADAINAQGHASAGVDLALGVLLLAIGALIFTERLPRRRAHPPSERSQAEPKKTKDNGWAQRVLPEPRPGIAVLVGAIIGPTRRPLPQRAAQPHRGQVIYRHAGHQRDRLRRH